MEGVHVATVRPGFCTVWSAREPLGLLDVDVDALAAALWQTGAVLLRGFGLDGQDFEWLTTVFSQDFCVDRGLTRKPIAHLSPSTRQVTAPVPHTRFGLHAELATTNPDRPPLIWFYCAQPPSQGGETLLCDGVAVYEEMGPAARAVFSPGQRVRHGRRAPVPVLSRIKGIGAWAFANGVVSRETYAEASQRIRLADGRPLPRAAFEAAVEAAEAATIAVTWEKGDILVVDNMRCMHGRNAFPAGDGRALYVRVARDLLPGMAP